MQTAGADGVNTRDRIVLAAVELLAANGRAAVSTRSVCALAGVQAPTIYRLFGDKQGLWDAVAAHGYAAHLRSHAAQETGPDPVEDLRRGWDVHVKFGLANPFLYSLIYGEPVAGRAQPSAAVAADGILAGHVHRIARAGWLRVPEDRATRLVHAAGCGTTLTLIGMPPDQRDPALSDLARESAVAAVVTVAGAAVTTAAPATAGADPVAAAVQLRALLPLTTALTERERGLLGEWLDRVAGAG